MVRLEVSWQQALAWRMRRQLLEPLGSRSVEDTVRRLGGVQAQVASFADLAVALRRHGSRAGEANAALAEGRLIKTWAMRGTLHLLTPEDGGAFLSLLAAGRSWELPSWRSYFGMDPGDLIARLRVVVREALTGGPLTREELVAAVSGQRGLDGIGIALRSSWGSILKPLAWHGDLCFGPSRGSRVTFMLPEHASPAWAGVPDPSEAAPRAIAAYLRAYGPATFGNFRAWLARGRVGTPQMKAWLALLGTRLAAVEVEGQRAYLLADDVDELAATMPTEAVRLLAGFDQYVLGAGTEDAHVVPAARRRQVSRQSGWISPVVLAGGAVAGTWQLDGGEARIAWLFVNCTFVPVTDPARLQKPPPYRSPPPVERA